MARPDAPDPMAADVAALTGPDAADLTAQDRVPTDPVAAGAVPDAAEVPAVRKTCLSVNPSISPAPFPITT
jgi:hypothetical protein